LLKPRRIRWENRELVAQQFCVPVKSNESEIVFRVRGDGYLSLTFEAVYKLRVNLNGD